MMLTFSMQDSSAKFDAFAVIELDNQRQQTERCTKTRAPGWHTQHFDFERAQLGKSVRVTIKDYTS